MPCQFVRGGTIRQLKELLDQFVSEGVLVSNNTCDFASPLVIIHKKEGGIRMAVDYREVNLQLDGTANQLPYKAMLFQKLGKSISPRSKTYGDIISCVWRRRARRLRLLSHHGVSTVSWPEHLEFQQHWANIKPGL